MQQVTDSIPAQEAGLVEQLAFPLLLDTVRAILVYTVETARMTSSSPSTEAIIPIIPTPAPKASSVLSAAQQLENMAYRVAVVLSGNDEKEEKGYFVIGFPLCK